MKKLNLNIEETRMKLKETVPLIHCITNPISINQCANIILALGASPIMAEHPEEVLEITRASDALLLNLGSITEARLESIRISATAAKEKHIPVVLDAVGVAASKLRHDFSAFLLTELTPTLLKGNYSEIEALHNTEHKGRGVDSDPGLSVKEVSRSAAALARRLGCFVLASGKCDIVTDGKTVIHIKNGVEKMSRVTGTGCMLGAVCACFLSVKQSLFSVSGACAFLGICGELSDVTRGPASFSTSLIDNAELLSADIFEERKKTEAVFYEEA